MILFNYRLQRKSLIPHPPSERLIKTVLAKRLFRLFLVATAVMAASHFAIAGSAPVSITVSSKASLIHLGSIDSFDITEGGVGAARELLEALETGSPDHASRALTIYLKLIPDENFGGEYTALAWFCDYLLFPEDKRKEMISDPFVKAFYDFFAEDNYATLKEYLGRKYHLREFQGPDTLIGQMRLGFLEDFILFNNPRREQWEKTSKILKTLQIKPGEKIADIGGGPGYYTFKFSDLVGSSGHIYSIDINFLHNAFVKDYSKLNNISNVTIVHSTMDSIGLPDNSVDLAFSCSLYHIIYTTFNEPEKDNFIKSIKSALKDDGRLVIVDNGPVADETLPYHGPYIAQGLIVTQLEHYGFRLESFHQIIPQRYVMTFKKKKEAEGADVASNPSTPPAAAKEMSVSPDGKVFEIPIVSRQSIVHVPNDMAPDTTAGGREAAILFHSALESKKKETAEAARKAYQELIPKEKFGDEYTAFEWMSEYLSASPDRQKEMLKDPLVANYFAVLSANDFQILKSYVLAHYKLHKQEDGTVVMMKDQMRHLEELEKERQEKGEEKPAEDTPQSAGDVKVTSALRMAFLDKKGEKTDPALAESNVKAEEMVFWRDFIIFNNPQRGSWEKSSRILDVLKLKPGQSIADIGSGPGYYSFKFSKLVGPTGRVYAVDTNKRHLDYVEKLSDATKTNNVQVVLSDLNDAKLVEDSVDVAFLCSLYSTLYAASIEKVKDEFIASVRKALKPNGRLIVVDNDIVQPPNLPYHGPYIDKRLITAQLANYGFRLTETYQIIPQRYVLVFEEAPSNTDKAGTEKKPGKKGRTSAN